MTRPFTCDGEEWVAWESGGGAYGTGIHARGNVAAVHFARAATPEVAVFEALIAAGAFANLYDDELIKILRTARKVVDPADLPARPVTRRGVGLS